MQYSKFLAATVLAIGSLSAHADSLITNGTFEDFSGTPLVSGYTVINAGSSALTGWTVGGTSVDLIANDYGAVSGYSIDMLGTPGPGSLSQSFATVIGQQYTLSFDLSANGGGDGKALTVSLTGVAPASYMGSTPFTTQTLNFVASNASTTLMFTSAASGYSGAVIDNVSVTAVPEPETYAMLLAGLGLMGAVVRRRNQA